MITVAKAVPDTEVIQTYLDLFEEFRQQQLYEKAEETLFLALDKHPNHQALLTQLSNLYIKLDMPEKALEKLNQLIAHGEALSFPYFLRGEIFESDEKAGEAISNYQRALAGTADDIPVLYRLLPLLIGENRIDEAIAQVEYYQNLFNDRHLLAEFEAEAYAARGNYSAAFRKMRGALLQNPGSAPLLKRYLQLSIQGSKKSTTEVYELLKLAIPGLLSLSREELLELEIDYFIHHRQFEAALEKANELLEEASGSNDAQKRKVLAKLKTHLIHEDMEKIHALFLENSSDREVRDILEIHFKERQRLDDWIEVVQAVLKHHPQEFELFNYLLRLRNEQDWLSMGKLDYIKFIIDVERLKINRWDLKDITYEKLPLYALETFVTQIAIHNTVPNPAEIWKIIYEHRQKKQQIPPFQLEDIEAAYPVWLFVLHIYFLFKSHSEFSVSFSPRAFQSEGIAVLIEKENVKIEVDISYLLGREFKKPRHFLKTSGGWRWFWQFDELTPDVMLHEIKFYSSEQFNSILHELNDVIGN